MHLQFTKVCRQQSTWHKKVLVEYVHDMMIENKSMFVLTLNENYLMLICAFRLQDDSPQSKSPHIEKAVAEAIADVSSLIQT